MKVNPVCGKSLLIGMVLGGILLLAAGAERAPATRPDEPRYQISAWAHDEMGSGHGAFVLDTRTGEVLSVIGRNVVRAENDIVADYKVEKVKR